MEVYKYGDDQASIVLIQMKFYSYVQTPIKHIVLADILWLVYLLCGQHARQIDLRQ